MAIDSIAPETTVDRSCSASASASDTSGGDGEPRPLGDKCLELKKLLRVAPPEYLTLSLTPSSASAAEKYRHRKRTGEVSLANVDAPRDFLSLLLTPSDERQPKRRRVRRHGSGGGGSVVTDAPSAASSGTAEGALVVVEAVLPPPPPVQIPATCLPPKKRNLAAAGVYQETTGTAPASSSPCLALAIVNHQDGVTPPSSPPGDGETRPTAAMASHPIDAVPLQAVYVHDGVPHQFRLSSGTGEIITTDDGETMGVPPDAAAGGSKASREV